SLDEDDLVTDHGLKTRQRRRHLVSAGGEAGNAIDTARVSDAVNTLRKNAAGNRDRCARHDRALIIECPDENAAGLDLRCCEDGEEEEMCQGERKNAPHAEPP